MTTKHTPGPWRLIKDDPTKRRPWPVFSIDADECLHLLTNQALDEADARLMAAAPVLLEALEEARKFILGIGTQAITTKDIWNKIDAAIALAKGDGH